MWKYDAQIYRDHKSFHETMWWIYASILKACSVSRQVYKRKTQNPKCIRSQRFWYNMLYHELCKQCYLLLLISFSFKEFIWIWFDTILRADCMMIIRSMFILKVKAACICSWSLCVNLVIIHALIGFLLKTILLRIIPSIVPLLASTNV